MVYGDTVLVTGASSGVGKSIAQMLENGYKVYGTTRARLNQAAKLHTVKKIRKVLLKWLPWMSGRKILLKSRA